MRNHPEAANNPPAENRLDQGEDQHPRVGKQQQSEDELHSAKEGKMLLDYCTTTRRTTEDQGDRGTTAGEAPRRS